MVYFITGASSGIGRECAKLILKKGEKVVLFSRREELLKKLEMEIKESGGQVFVVKGDVRYLEELKEGMQKAKEYFGELNNLLCAAGIGFFSPFIEQEPWQFKEMLEINTLGVINSVYAFLPFILNRGGKIGIISSIQGKMGFKNMCVYGASKFSLHGFVQGLREELKIHNIKISLVCPGTVETPFLDLSGRKHIPRQSRFLRVLSAEEVAKITVDAMERGKKETIVPFMAKLFLKFHDIFPQFAEWLFYKL